VRATPFRPVFRIPHSEFRIVQPSGRVTCRLITKWGMHPTGIGSEDAVPALPSAESGRLPPVAVSVQLVSKNRAAQCFKMGQRRVPGPGRSEAKEDPAHLRLAFSGASLPLVATALATRRNTPSRRAVKYSTPSNHGRWAPGLRDSSDKGGETPPYSGLRPFTIQAACQRMTIAENIIDSWGTGHSRVPRQGPAGEWVISSFCRKSYGNEFFEHAS